MQSEFFEWDDRKAASNLRKHEVDFEEAKTIFEDPEAVTIKDEFYSGDELRWITVGQSLLLKVL